MVTLYYRLEETDIYNGSSFILCIMSNVKLSFHENMKEHNYIHIGCMGPAILSTIERLSSSRRSKNVWEMIILGLSFLRALQLRRTL